ncbi:MAG: HAD family hydrolase, partial [Candidatus Bathyarchaeia archaeon]
MRARAVLFDLDGTLVETRIDFAKMKSRMRGFLASQRVDLSALPSNATTQQLMDHARNVMRAGGRSRDEICRVFAQMEAIMDEVEMESADQTTAIPGALDALKQLSLRGISLAVVTRGCRGYAVAALRAAALLNFIDLVVGRDDVAHPKPHPGHLHHTVSVLGVDLGDCVMVGDTLMDALCARGAGVPFIAVLTGFRRRDDFEENGCDVILSGVSDLP